jgi:hypothetical protein
MPKNRRFPKGPFKKLSPEELRERRVLILQQLQTTENSFAQIARDLKVPPEVVSRVSRRYAVRDRATIKRIFREVLSVIGKKSRERQKPVKLFSGDDKMKLLAKHNKAIQSVARDWFFGKTRSSNLIRTEYGTLENLVNSIEAYLFYSLDYYDPKRIGISGKTKTPFGYIYKGAGLFCMSTATRLRKSKMGERQMPVAMRGPKKMRGRPISELMVVKTTAAERNQSYKAMIPTLAKPFLKKFGLEPETMSEQDFTAFKRLVLEVAREKESNVNESELFIIQNRLLGRTLKDIGEDIGGITKERVRHLQNRVIKKVIALLRQRLQKKSSR